jgi:hypothetical protein
MRIGRCGSSEFVRTAQPTDPAAADAAKKVAETEQKVLAPIAALEAVLNSLLDANLKGKIDPSIGNMKRALETWKTETMANQLGVAATGAPPAGV